MCCCSAGLRRPGVGPLAGCAGGCTRERAIAIQLRGIGHEVKEDYPSAIAAYRETLHLFRTLSADSEDVGRTLNDLSHVEKLSGDLAPADRDLREALRVARAVGDAEGVATYTGNLAARAFDREDWLEAETLARQALALSEELGRQQLIARNYHRIADALVCQGKRNEALPYARRAMDIYTQLGVASMIEAARETLEECEA